MRRRSERILVASYVGGCSVLGLTGAWAQQRIWPQLQEPGAAPEFALNDLDGEEVSLAGLRGEDRNKVVVLEWFDPRCDWVKTYHDTTTAMRDLRADFAGAAWAAIYSSIPPEGEEPATMNRKAAERWGIRYPILLDEGGAVAELYGAERAPYVVVISRAGRVVYSGAVDDSTTPGEVGAQNHLRQALEAATRGETPVKTSAAAPGCRLKAPEPSDEGRA